MGYRSNFLTCAIFGAAALVLCQQAPARAANIAGALGKNLNIDQTAPAPDLVKAQFRRHGGGLRGGGFRGGGFRDSGFRGGGFRPGFTGGGFRRGGFAHGRRGGGFGAGLLTGTIVGGAIAYPYYYGPSYRRPYYRTSYLHDGRACYRRVLVRRGHGHHRHYVKRLVQVPCRAHAARCHFVRRAVWSPYYDAYVLKRVRVCR